MNQPTDPNSNTPAEELARLIQAVSAASNTILPVSSDALLNSIVEAAAKIFGAAAASILLINETGDKLEFKVSYGAGSRDLVGVSIPINQGIAGYVAMSAQPISISDVAQDTRFNQDFARSTGYVPHSILATPLLAGERVIGVMEVLDKINAPSFGMKDMELLGLFSRQAALAIDQSQKIENISEALLLSLKRLGSSDPAFVTDNLVKVLEASRNGQVQNDLIKLVDMLNEFGHMGEKEQEVALKILSVFSEYGQYQRKLNVGSAWK
jgi:GAF domain-containing protein